MAGPTGPYRLAFITSTMHNAVSTDIADYNAYVQGLADAAGIGMGGTYGDLEWNVIGSTATVDARDNTGTNPLVDGVGVPIYLVDGTTLVANDNTDLWDGVYTGSGQDNTGGVQHIIDQTENGDVFAHWPFTGTNLDGTAALPLGSGGNVSQGQGNDPTRWIWRQWTWQNVSSELPMYAMSAVIPEPATMALLGLGGLTLLRRRRNG
ncbi:MAG: PEP-CTERM sorting domain-containing protein [Phycisphaerae bacterium]|nr:PEP-CTERM sorting domain-containing protein [Phycisphaerae bacterium]